MNSRLTKKFTTAGTLCCVIALLMSSNVLVADDLNDLWMQYRNQSAAQPVNPDAIYQPVVETTQELAQAPAQPGNADCEECKKAADEAAKKQKELQKKVATAHKGLFFNNDFSYLCDPDYCGWKLGDSVKKISLPRGGCLDLGGQYRMRYQGERNIRGLGLTGVDDDFLLHRTRLYADWRVGPKLRFYGEFLDAESNYENLSPRPIEVNRHEMQNLFVDARVFEQGDRSVTVRVGRQELLYGEQRAVSPLDWANTRRTFEGVNVLAKAGKFSIDSFWTHPVRVDDQNFDSPNRDQEFMGIYSTYSGRKNQIVDLYFLRYLNGSGTNDFKFNTLGTRWKGNRDKFLWDCELAYQFGSNTDGSDHAAGMVTGGLGRKISDVGWKPEIWAYYDYASGDNDTGAGNGFDHNFPLAHKYLGFMDLFGRRNLEDVNLLLTMQPAKKLKLLVWYHYLFLATQSDTPYSVAMTPFNPGNAPGSPDLGHEIDLLATYTLGPRHKINLGYSHFFSGAYYSTTAGVPFSGDADFFYTEYTLNF